MNTKSLNASPRISDVNEGLLHNEVQEFIEEHYKEEVSRIVFQGSPFEGISIKELATQLAGQKKAEKKLPSWFITRGIIYPPSLNLEQTSSETTAAYKASLVSGQSLVDLTGGFGVDSYFFAQKMQQVIHCELNSELSELVTHNSKLLMADNIQTYLGNGMEYLRKSLGKFDWIYIDPSRRNDVGGRVFRLTDCQPDVPQNLELLLQKAPRILVKTSPLLDLHSGAQELQKVQEIHILAVNNEVKEVLWVLADQEKEPKDILVSSLNLTRKGKQVYTNTFLKEAEVEYGIPQEYLYEPNSAIMKSGLFNAVGADFGIQKLHPNTHLYSSSEKIEFPGRRFRILERLAYAPKKLKRALSMDRANITTRNFQESVASLRKKFKLKDGGDDYIFFTTTGENERIALICRKD